MTLPNVSCVKLPSCLLEICKWYGLNPYWISVAGYKLIWTKAYVALKYHKAFLF